MVKINTSSQLQLGDYVTFKESQENKIIFEVISLENYPNIVVKLIYPRELSQSLKESSVFSFKIPLKFIGNPKKEKSLRILYG